MASALGSLYYTALGLKAPNTAVPIPNNTVGPFSNFQPYLYWSQTNGQRHRLRHFFFQYRVPGQQYHAQFPVCAADDPGQNTRNAARHGQGLQVNPGGQTVYDPVTNVTWLANANLAATNTFGLPTCKDQGTPKLCVNQDGAMNWNSADQFVTNMNA